jgi:hypothetical protein
MLELISQLGFELRIVFETKILRGQFFYGRNQCLCHIGTTELAEVAR